MLEEVSRDQAEKYLEALSEGKSNRHYNANLNLLSKLYKWSIRHGWTKENPFSEISQRKCDTHSHANFSDEEVTRIFESFDSMTYQPRDKDELRTLMTLACWTGLRMTDAIHVRKSDVDFGRDIITVTPQKTMRSSGITVRIPLHSALREELRQADARTPGEEYFMPNLVRRYDNPSTRGSIGKAVERIICDALGVEGQVEVEGRERRANAYGLHSFRHTFISFCASAGVPIEVVKAMVGHTTDVTRVYTHISEKAMRGAIDALETKSADLRERVSALVRNASQRQLEACLAILQN
ncbi:MAG: tyrosine-type recombinase/integrase [Oligosphaeraceae bacterium]